MSLDSGTTTTLLKGAAALLPVYSSTTKPCHHRVIDSRTLLTLQVISQVSFIHLLTDLEYCTRRLRQISQGEMISVALTFELSGTKLARASIPFMA